MLSLFSSDHLIQITKSGSTFTIIMGIRADIREEVQKETVTKIHGKPTNQDLTTLKKELIAILANIPTTLGGGNHGHAGIIMDPARYLLMTGAVFVKEFDQSGSGTQRVNKRV